MIFNYSLPWCNSVVPSPHLLFTVELKSTFQREITPRRSFSSHIRYTEISLVDILGMMNATPAPGSLSDGGMNDQEGQ